jgi:hypothetical protein
VFGCPVSWTRCVVVEAEPDFRKGNLQNGADFVTLEISPVCGNCSFHTDPNAKAESSGKIEECKIWALAAMEGY